jgi:pimeloyl-ACP methyl ester carboxylesterase
MVILVHGSESTSEEMADRAQMLADHGYGVLMIDWPGHGRSGGTPTWDELERRALVRAVDYCSSQPGVDPTRVGGIGVSSGAYILAQVAAKEPRLAAVVLEGCFTSVVELNAWQYRRYGWLGRYPALWTDRYYGMNTAQEQPIDVVASIAPRAVLIISGTADRVVPVSMSERLYSAVGNPKELWIVEGAAHADYFSHAPVEYARRIKGFFDKTLAVRDN